MWNSHITVRSGKDHRFVWVTFNEPFGNDKLTFFLIPFPLFTFLCIVFALSVGKHGIREVVLFHFAKESSDILPLPYWVSEVGEWVKCVLCALTPWIHLPCAALHPCHCPWSSAFSFGSCFSGYQKTIPSIKIKHFKSAFSYIFPRKHQ